MEGSQVLQVLVELDLISFRLSHHLEPLRIGKSDLESPQPSILPYVLVEELNQVAFKSNSNHEPLQPLRSSHRLEELHIFLMRPRSPALPHLKVKLLQLITVHHVFHFLDLLLLTAFIELIKQVWVLQDP
jgi:hypothetical protein